MLPLVVARGPGLGWPGGQAWGGQGPGLEWPGGAWGNTGEPTVTEGTNTAHSFIAE